MDKIKEIRLKEKEYHEELYTNVDLYSEGTWLSKPVKTVLDSFNLLDKHNYLVVLDIGCGVGRNAIAIAKELKGTNGKVICIDILDTAITKLEEYAKAYDVVDHIKPVTTSIEDYDFTKDTYDFVIAVSTLEHIESLEALQKTITELSIHTKPGGIHCFIFNTSIKEYDKETNKELTPQFELNLDTLELSNILDELYKDWHLTKKDIKQYMFDIIRDEQEVLLDTTVLTYVVNRKPLIRGRD